MVRRPSVARASGFGGALGRFPAGRSVLFLAQSAKDHTDSRPRRSHVRGVPWTCHVATSSLAMVAVHSAGPASAGAEHSERPAITTTSPWVVNVLNTFR